MRNNELIQNGFKYSLTVLAGIALALTTINVNSGCLFISHQGEIPSVAKQLRKF